LNDERPAIKKSINRFLGSRIVEEIVRGGESRRVTGQLGRACVQNFHAFYVFVLIQHVLAANAKKRDNSESDETEPSKRSRVVDIPAHESGPPWVRRPQE
jgi:hypothetical protein